MTEEQKDLLIAKMLDAPSTLSDEELEAIVNDEELADIYKISAEVSGACRPQPEMDVAKEWARFRPRLRQRPSFSKRFMRVAAMFAGIVFASSIAVKVVDNVFTGNQKMEVAQTYGEASPSSAQAQAVIEPAPATEVSTASPEAEAKRKPHAPSPHPPKAKKSATDTGGEPIDVDEYLRIQQAKIDNELALLQAEIIAEQQSSLYRMIEYLEENGNNENFRLTTMQ